MWSVIRPAALQSASRTAGAFRVIGVTSRLASRRVASPASRLVLLRARGMATEAAAKKPRTRAAATKKPAAKKPAAKKKPVAKKKVVKPKKKVVKKVKAKAKPKAVKKKREPTPDEVRRALKRAALYQKEPKNQLPQTASAVFMSGQLKGRTKEECIGSMGEIWARYQNLGELELQSLRATAEQNRLANEAAYKAWVATHTPKEIYTANVARKRLTRDYKIKTHAIKDDRIPKRAPSAMNIYVAEKIGDFRSPGATIGDAFKKAITAWKALSSSEQQVYIRQAEAAKAKSDKARVAAGLL